MSSPGRSALVTAWPAASSTAQRSWPEHAGGAGDEPARHQRVTTCWVRAYFASVASFIGRHHASLSRYHSIVAASPSRKLP